ncbi:MAG: hypothetical protein KDD48_07275 [Bdellovibrionales bacterium]|nr:hypothetical protein [Bdellovibrionales bacterium]
MSLTRFQDTEHLASDIETFAKRLDELRLAYDQYFNGVIREQPADLRAKVFAFVQKLSGQSLQNARLRFKLQQTIAKYNSYAILWDRTLREIEEGRHRRDLFRLKIKKNPHPSADSSTSTEQSKSTSNGASPAKNDPWSDLFSKFVASKKSCREPIEGLTLEAFKKTLTARIQTLGPQVKGKKVKFQVTTEDGKTRIKTLIS